MERLKKQISLFLLLVFGLASFPAPVLHDLLADHTDAADNHCRYYHKDLGRHIEEQQEHCDVFKTNTPLYDALKVQNDIKLYVCVISAYTGSEIAPLYATKPLNLPSRAPPTA